MFPLSLGNSPNQIAVTIDNSSCVSAAWEEEGEGSSFLLSVSLKKSCSLHYHEFLLQSASHFQDAFLCFLLMADFFHNLYSSAPLRVGCFTSLSKATLVHTLIPCICHNYHTECLLCRHNSTAAIYLIIESRQHLLKKIF